MVLVVLAFLPLPLPTLLYGYVHHPPPLLAFASSQRQRHPTGRFFPLLILHQLAHPHPFTFTQLPLEAACTHGVSVRVREPLGLTRS